jgi:hypothetical protein
MRIKHISVNIHYFIYYRLYYFSFMFPLQFHLPENETKWKEATSGYNSVWSFPHCTSAVGVKYVQLTITLYFSILLHCV